jgi:excisionase family DNA binding protein
MLSLFAPYPSSTSDDRVATLNEAAVYTGISISSLRRAAKRGELRILRLSPRRVGIRLADLRAFLDSRGGAR